MEKSRSQASGIKESVICLIFPNSSVTLFISRLSILGETGRRKHTQTRYDGEKVRHSKEVILVWPWDTADNVRS